MDNWIQDALHECQHDDHSTLVSHAGSCQRHEPHLAVASPAMVERRRVQFKPRVSMCFLGVSCAMLNLVVLMLGQPSWCECVPSNVPSIVCRHERARKSGRQLAAVEDEDPGMEQRRPCWCVRRVHHEHSGQNALQARLGQKILMSGTRWSPHVAKPQVTANCQIRWLERIREKCWQLSAAEPGCPDAQPAILISSSTDMRSKRDWEQLRRQKSADGAETSLLTCFLMFFGQSVRNTADRMRCMCGVVGRF